MENLSKMGSFESFRLSKQTMNQISGSRSRSFETREGYNGSTHCIKVVDDSNGQIIKEKEKIASKCD
jgi:hypothetical protein